MGIVDHVPGLLGKVSSKSTWNYGSFQLKVMCVYLYSINITLSIWFDIWICVVFAKIQKLVEYGY